MNEWELTDEEITKAAFDAYGAWDSMPQKYSVALADFQRRAIATAAQKKLVEWLENHTESFDNFEIQQFFMEWEGEPFLSAGDRYIKQADWQALREAAGGGGEVNKRIRLILRVSDGGMEGATIQRRYFTREVTVEDWPEQPRGAMSTQPEVIGAEMLECAEAAGGEGK